MNVAECVWYLKELIIFPSLFPLASAWLDFFLAPSIDPKLLALRSIAVREGYLSLESNKDRPVDPCDSLDCSVSRQETSREADTNSAADKSPMLTGMKISLQMETRPQWYLCPGPLFTPPLFWTSPAHSFQEQDPQGLLASEQNTPTRTHMHRNFQFQNWVESCSF